MPMRVTMETLKVIILIVMMIVVMVMVMVMVMMNIFGKGCEKCWHLEFIIKAREYIIPVH